MTLRIPPFLVRAPRTSGFRASALRATRALALAAALASLSGAQGTPGGGPQQSPEPYAVLDQVGGSWVNLATFPVRPMAFDAQNDLWVVNHLDSTVEHFVGQTSTPDKVYGVPWSPVAIAWWDGNGTPELLVVCRGTWAVMGINPGDGTPKRLLQLRPGATLPGGLPARIGLMAEPGDILVDQEHDRAFVSCTGADSVVQIDLVNNQIVRVFHDGLVNGAGTDTFTLKSPLFLSFLGDDVLCAPLHSGNNSLSQGGLHGATVVEDGEDPALYPTGLPDEDLFRIHPLTATNPGSVEPVLRDTGTILFAHGVHPTTGEFWQLNTEALNKDPDHQTEPSVQGTFAQNRVTIVHNPWSTPSQTHVGLDPDPLTPITTDNTVGQPFALAFNSAGQAFVTGLLTDNVMVLDQNGTFLMEWDLPDGSIPRGVLPHPTLNKVFVYLWGLNEVRSYRVFPESQSATLKSTHNLRHDPTPTSVAAGRKLFFDGMKSKFHNLSCATCHVEGGNDFLAWNLSNGELEQKGPMFTQTLVGLKRLGPFHWRGERQLVDFNTFAFTGLLGAPAKLSDTEFANFQDFLFSLTNPANPNQNRKRLLDPTIHHPDTPVFQNEPPPDHDTTVIGDAVLGQNEYQSSLNIKIGRHSCVDCHDFPTGTVNDIVIEGDFNRARRVSMKVAPFHEGWRKQQKRVEVLKVDQLNPTGPLIHLYPAFLGSGFAHTGAISNLFRFMSLVVENYDDQKAKDITDFIHQWDQGLGLAVHFAYLINSANANSTTTTAELTTYLHGEMGKGNCDIAVMGMSRATPLSSLVLCRWAWDRTISAYVCENPSFANRSLANFQSGAASNNEVNVFVGLPRGMAERFAIDYDLDGVRNKAEPVGGEYNKAVPANSETVAPGYAAGGTPQVLWQTTKVARLVFTTTEPTTAEISYVEPKTASHTVKSPLLSRYHSVLLTDLRPSTHSADAGQVAADVTPYDAETVNYSATIKLTDARNNLFNDPTSYVFASDPFDVPIDLEQGLPDTEDPEHDGGEYRDRRSHVVQAICMRGAGCEHLTLDSGKWRADVDFTIAYKRGKWVSDGAGGFEPVRVARRAVFGRVLIERLDGSVETAEEAGLAVEPLDGTAALVSGVLIDKDPFGVGDTTPVEGVPSPSGDFLAGLTPTDAQGHTTISFRVAPYSSTDPFKDLGTGDRIVFNVEGVLEVGYRGQPPIPEIVNANDTVTYGVRWRASYMEWSFPETKEARASVKSAPLQ